MDILYIIFLDLFKRIVDEIFNVVVCIFIDDDDDERFVLMCGEFFNKVIMFVGILV